jgi:Fe-S-cluster containining protein
MVDVPMAEPESETPWYREGLRFACTGCGNCCSGEPGFVWVDEQDAAKLAEMLQLDVDDFEQLYLRKIGARRSLKEFPNGDCVFLDGDTRRCNVYSARPRQCQTWPFWDSNLRTPEDWQRTCAECPGSGTGKLYSLNDIERQRAVTKI